MRWRRSWHWASLGLAIGCFAAVVLACISLAAPSLALGWLPLVALACAAAAGVAGLCVPVSLVAAAGVVDSFYGMKDRAITALQFESDSDSVRQMQVHDAKLHLRQVRPADCIPYGQHRVAWSSAAAMSALSIAIVLFGQVPGPETVAARPVSLAADQADRLRETMLKEIEQMQAEQEQPEVEALSEELEELLDKLENHSIDERDMMATLSEMEQSVAQARESLQLEMTDAQMKAIAAALEPSESLQQAAAAMARSDYESASKQLDTADPNSLSDKERRAVADNLKKFLAKLSPGQQGKLSGAADQLRRGLQNKNPSQCKDGMGQLASLCKAQASRKKIGQCMACQLNRLAQCKSECRGACQKNGGNSAAKKKTPSESWGKGSTGQANDGESTRLDSVRREEQLTGTQGEGPSESEVIQAPEGEQAAARRFAKRYQKFRSQAEAVLETEPLPLGHRETVRQYFESIRPDKQIGPLE